MASALPRNHMAVANKQPRSNPRRDSVAPSFTAGQTRSLSTTRSAFRDCRRRLSIAYAASAVDTEKPYLKCVNPFRDEWVLVKVSIACLLQHLENFKPHICAIWRRGYQGGESLGTEFRDINK